MICCYNQFKIHFKELICLFNNLRHYVNCKNTKYSVLKRNKWKLFKKKFKNFTQWDKLF